MTDFLKVAFGMNSRDDGCAEFVVSAAPHDDFHAFLKVLDSNIGSARSERIFFRRMLDIHCPEIDELGLGDASDNIGEGAVRIELYEEAKRFYFSDKVEEIAMKRRLATGDAHAIEFALSRLEEFQKFIRLVAARLHKVFFARLDEFGIVTKRAPQHAPERKYRRRKFPRVVEERQWLVSGEVHDIDMKSDICLYIFGNSPETGGRKDEP